MTRSYRHGSVRPRRPVIKSSAVSSGRWTQTLHPRAGVIKFCPRSRMCLRVRGCVRACQDQRRHPNRTPGYTYLVLSLYTPVALRARVSRFLG
eukprot:1558172-Prymnesium_polylepis.1